MIIYRNGMGVIICPDCKVPITKDNRGSCINEEGKEELICCHCESDLETIQHELGERF